MSTDGEKQLRRPTLPPDERERLWGAKGSGDACSHCRRPIDSDEVQLELVRPGGLPVLQFHVRCYDAWRTEPP